MIATFIASGGNNNVFTVFQSNGDGQIVAAGRNDRDDEAPFRILLAISTDFEASLSAAMTELREVVNESKLAQNLAELSTAKIHDSSSAGLGFDQWVDGIIFCTWNALGRNLSDSTITI